LDRTVDPALPHLGSTFGRALGRTWKRGVGARLPTQWNAARME
jgi:hypothetical protein